MKTKFSNLSRRAFLGAAGAAGLTLAACNGNGDGSSEPASFTGTITGTYTMHVQGYDYGAGVDKITLTLDAPLDAVAPEDLVVSEHKQATDWTAEGFPVVEADFERVVTNATVSGKDVELELACDPDNGSPFLYTMATGYNTWCDPYQLNITLAEGAELTSGGEAVTELSISPDATARTTSADEAQWTMDSYTASDGTEFRYAAWDPAEESKSLVIWLHGAGEGGIENTDPFVTILANKVVALSGDEFQQTVGGAHVVAPQSPTMWMDQDGKATYIADDATEVASIYTESLEEFIDAYAAQVGAEKIVLAGCSNGGFMTLWMGLHRPDKYAGIVPICEAIPDGAISDEQIEGIKNLPMYFIWSEDDDTVDPTTHEIPTTDRLKAAGAAELHIATTEHVVDTSGSYFDKDEDGNETPHVYSGHWSWIYFDNNESECNDDGLKAFDFIANVFK
jgi:predicted esterase